MPQAFWQSSGPGALSTLVTSVVVLYSLTRATLMSPGIHTYIYIIYIYIYIYLFIYKYNCLFIDKYKYLLIYKYNLGPETKF